MCVGCTFIVIFLQQRQPLPPPTIIILLIRPRSIKRGLLMPSPLGLGPGSRPRFPGPNTGPGRRH